MEFVCLWVYIEAVAAAVRKVEGAGSDDLCGEEFEICPVRSFVVGGVLTRLGGGWWVVGEGW